MTSVLFRFSKISLENVLYLLQLHITVAFHIICYLQGALGRGLFICAAMLIFASQFSRPMEIWITSWLMYLGDSLL